MIKTIIIIGILILLIADFLFIIPRDLKKRLREKEKVEPL